MRRGSVVLLKASEESLFLQKAEGRIVASQAGVECRSKGVVKLYIIWCHNTGRCGTHFLSVGPSM